MRLSLFFLFLCWEGTGFVLAQNLVSNENFEIYTSCPLSGGEIYKSSPWKDVQNSPGSVDYFHSCSPLNSYSTPDNIVGFQYPLNGEGYIGIISYVQNISNLREYSTIKLNCSLDSGINYQTGFFISRANTSYCAIDRLGMYLGDTIYGNGTYLLDMYVPQIQSTPGVFLEDTINWMEITGIFTAQGTEKYLAIGNFFSDSNTLVEDSLGLISFNRAYYYIDSVYVIPLTSPPAVSISNDTIICAGNSVILLATNSGVYYWFKQGFPLDTLSYSNTLTVTPTTSTTYLLQTCAVQLSVTVQVVNGPAGSFSLGNDTLLCTGSNLVLAAPHGYTYQWQDGSTEVAYNVNNAGLYHVAVSNACGMASDTIAVNYIAAPVISFADDTLLCPAQTLVLDATSDSAVYLWQDNTTAATYTATQTGVYWVRAENQCGVATDTIAVNYISPPVVELGNDTTVCGNTTLLLNAANDSASYLWQNNNTQPTYTVAQAGNYWVRVTNQCGVASDTLTVNYLAAPVIDFGNDTLLCPAQILLLDVMNDNATYLWQNNSTEATYTITQSGVYWARVENQCGIVTDTVEVNYINPPTLELGNDTLLCIGITLLLDASNDSASYLWQDNSINASYTVAQENIYWVQVSNQCGIASDTITVNYISSPEINFGNDTLLCPAEILLLDATNDSASYLWQNNAANETYTVTQNGLYWARVENQCGTASDTIVVNYINPPVVELGNDTILCGNTTLLLNAANDSATYLWQDNSTGGSYNVTVTNSYWVQVSNQCGLATDTIEVLYLQTPVSELGNDTAICPETTISFDVAQPQVTYLWHNGSTAPFFTADTAQTVWVVISNFCGTVSDTIIITMKDCDTIPHEIVIPNIITPNNDGVNDVFEIIKLPPNSQLLIYNRWGKRVYCSENYQNNWDAKDMSDGAYFYVLIMSGGEEKKGFLQVMK